MLTLQLYVNFIIFFIGIMGIILNRSNIILIIICLELLLLSQNLNFITFSVYLDDIVGQIFTIFVLTVAAAESAIGLALLIIYQQIHGNISGLHFPSLRG